MKKLFVKTITKSITDFKAMEIKRSLWNNLKGGGGGNGDGGDDFIVEDDLDG